MSFQPCLLYLTLSDVSFAFSIRKWNLSTSPVPFHLWILCPHTQLDAFPLTCRPKGYVTPHVTAYTHELVSSCDSNSCVPPKVFMLLNLSNTPVLSDWLGVNLSLCYTRLKRRCTPIAEFLSWGCTRESICSDLTDVQTHPLSQWGDTLDFAYNRWIPSLAKPFAYLANTLWRTGVRCRATM